MENLKSFQSYRTTRNAIAEYADEKVQIPAKVV